MIKLQADVPLLMDFSLVITKYEITGAKQLSLHCELTAIKFKLAGYMSHSCI